jgi:hypothetical protein
VACGRQGNAEVANGQSTLTAHFSKKPKPSGAASGEGDVSSIRLSVPQTPQNTPFLTLPTSFRAALRSIKSINFVAVVEFDQDVAAGFLGTGRGHLACAELSCWRMCIYS